MPSAISLKKGYCNQVRIVSGNNEIEDNVFFYNEVSVKERWFIIFGFELVWQSFVDREWGIAIKKIVNRAS